MMELTVGQHVIVPSGPPDHGQFTGVVTEVDEIRAIITPDEPALRAWFTNGYDIGRVHWPQLIPAEEGCPATPPGYPNWTCRQPMGHDGPHRRGPLTWTEE